MGRLAPMLERGMCPERALIDVDYSLEFMLNYSPAPTALRGGGAGTCIAGAAVAASPLEGLLAAAAGPRGATRQSTVAAAAAAGVRVVPGGSRKWGSGATDEGGSKGEVAWLSGGGSLCPSLVIQAMACSRVQMGQLWCWG